jgi:hypothetical protein
MATSAAPTRTIDEASARKTVPDLLVDLDTSTVWRPTMISVKTAASTVDDDIRLLSNPLSS